MDFQEKTGKLIGLSQILQQHTTDDIQNVVNLDHDYSKPPPADDQEANSKDEMIPSKFIQYL